MSTPVSEIYDIFLKRIGKDIMLEMEPYLVEDLLSTYLEDATVEFSECDKDLSINENSIVSDLSLEEKHILSRGMILCWLQPKIFTQEVIKNRITDGDYTSKSSGNLLNNLLKLKESAADDFKKSKVRYSYRGKNING